MRIQSEILRCSELSLYKTSEMDLISRKYRKSKSRVKRAIIIGYKAIAENIYFLNFIFSVGLQNLLRML